MRNENRVCYSKNLNENLYLVLYGTMVRFEERTPLFVSSPLLSFSFRKDLLQKNSFIFLLVVVIFCAEVAKEKTSEE